MATIGYCICLVLSMMVIIYMATKNYENMNTYYWTIVELIPIIVLGYWLKTRITSPEAAIVLFCFIYLDSTVLLVVTIFSMVYALGVRMKPWVKVAGYTVAGAHMFLVWGSINNNLYYKSMVVNQSAYGSYTKMTSGPLKIVHVIYLAIIVLIILGIIVTGFIKKNTYSRRTLTIYSALAVIAIVLYALESFMDFDFSFLPYLYVIGDIFVACDYDHTHMHDIAFVISEHQRYSGNRGYAALDLQGRLLSRNTKVFEFAPELKTQRIDAKVNSELFEKLIAQYRENGKASIKFTINEMTCACEVNHFSLRKDGRAQGYLFDFRDATEEQKVLDVMTSYNETLNSEIKKKTDNIAYIQQKIVVGMANIIENRDNNTGGHVKRTSDIIGIIVEEIVKQGDIKLSDQFAHDIVRAAPMHDLGKVSIDSTILCKRGRLNDDEYRIMKTHSTKSGEMVMILLDGVEEDHFVKTAYNIARYHHERWDGHGYPEGLVGSMTPIEARIMAIADVYDALVSKRCYKEAMSFPQAYKIMLEGMGTQFDPNMKKVFIGCHEKLEAYYKETE